MDSLSGKIAVVTGASRGIGAGIAIEFAKRGAKAVAITYVSNSEAANETVRKLESLGCKAVAIKADLVDEKVGDIIVQATLEAFQTTKIDILVNNAANIKLFPFSKCSYSDYRDMFDANVAGTLFTTQAFLRVINRGGRIINIGSRLGKVPGPSPFVLYSTVKAAVDQLTKCLAIEYAAPLGITINTVMPGPTETDAISSVDSATLERLKALPTAEKRLGTVEEVAHAVAFIAGDGSRWINGDTISVTGGAVMW